MFYQWKPYVPVAERRRTAERAMAKRKKEGHTVCPVLLSGRTIATTFWGKAWCDNLERYSDYDNRLPRGRTYVRNGSVVDLQISSGAVNAFVAGSDLYKVAIKVLPVPKPRWSSICRDCAGAIDSLVELLQGRFSKGVMERMCQAGTGLFPPPSEIKLSCSCPDSASMCKHIAAVLYGVGARLDTQPELLFHLRNVDEKELIARAARDLPLTSRGPEAGRVLPNDGLADLFGLEMAGNDPTTAGAAPSAAAKSTRSKTRKPASPLAAATATTRTTSATPVRPIVTSAKAPREERVPRARKAAPPVTRATTTPAPARAAKPAASSRAAKPVGKLSAAKPKKGARGAGLGTAIKEKAIANASKAKASARGRSARAVAANSGE